MFATIGVIADQPSSGSKKHAGKSHRHVGAAGASSSLPTVEAPSPTSLTTVEAPCSSPSLQHMLNRSKVLPKPSHRVQHFLVTEGRPVNARYRRLDNERLEAAIPHESLGALTQLNCLHFGGFLPTTFCGIFTSDIWQIFLSSFLYEFDFFSDIKYV